MDFTKHPIFIVLYFLCEYIAAKLADTEVVLRLLGTVQKYRACVHVVARNFEFIYRVRV